MVFLVFLFVIIFLSGVIRLDEFLMILDSILYELIKDFSVVIVFGGW